MSDKLTEIIRAELDAQDVYNFNAHCLALAVREYMLSDEFINQTNLRFKGYARLVIRTALGEPNE